MQIKQLKVQNNFLEFTSRIKIWLSKTTNTTHITNIIIVNSELVLVYKFNKQSKIYGIVHNLLTNKTENCRTINKH